MQLLGDDGSFPHNNKHFGEVPIPMICMLFFYHYPRCKYLVLLNTIQIGMLWKDFFLKKD